jgi:hypothetical protein
MEIKIKMLYGGNLALRVKRTDTVESLKYKIAENENISPAQQKLVFAGKILNDDKKLLESYDIVENSVIHMIVALRGG